MEQSKRERHRLRGLFRVSKNYPDKPQIKALQDYGCHSIYEWSQVDDLLHSLRKGDLVPMPRAACLGPTQADQRRVLKTILEKGADVLTLDTNLHSENRHHMAEIPFEAMSQIIGDRKASPREAARAYGRMSGKRKRQLRTDEMTAGEFWRASKNWNLTDKEMVMQPEMKGWTASTAYRLLGSRGIFTKPNKRKSK